MEKRDLYRKYLHYGEPDFLSDDSFQDWAFNPNPENELFWTEMEQLFPEKKDTIQKALYTLRSIRFKEHIPDEQQVDAAFANHIDSLNKAGLLDYSTSATQPPRQLWYNIRKIAATFIGLLLLSGLYLLLKTREHETIVKTDFGETKQLVLPDGSQVELNANSSIRYEKEWKKGRKREIWLEGEALFKVVHINQDSLNVRPEEYFVVRTAGLKITVLGTVFDVRQRREVTEVVLQKGKVKVSFDRKHLADLILTPGKRIVYSNQNVKEDLVETQNYTAWKEKKLLLINPTIKEIAQYLEDNFGKKIITSDSALNNKMIAGPIPISSLNDALFVISTVSNVDVIRRDSSTILLKRR
ncbi:FecR family protein [Arcticibacter tournemirensis]|uniref:DUF4974 domain-containing protein n=1 Tax=Arcticibacter tournemirensis TaxID=699437 RepID=A0A5M9H4Z3_9SPHI|nr:FecR domain-containing protein [Arcticibacter tournemirensis]KAA8480208.1 DUF4974 domain-containing protein [Arcticibacter tournemirensis]TQM46766.1 FecR family protein [Arcticibacter tournemirensis]